jgi:mono/diheme cytochrome c family protein
MLKFRTVILAAALLLAVLLGGCGLSLAEDITPPPNYKAPTAEALQPVAASTAFPLTPPDPVQGKAIFVEKCAACHGETGMGDGPQAANLANPVAPLGSPELARASRPADWYTMVTQGNLEKFMPGFASLNDRQRWDVVAYALTLSTNPEEQALGQSLYEANCAACHGKTGGGDGEQAAGLPVKPASWTDEERLAGLSAVDMTRVMAGGKEGHTSFADVLDETQRYAVASYIRKLSFTASEQDTATAAENAANSAAADAAATPDAAAEVPATITIQGTITNGSGDAALPAGMKVIISAYQGMDPAFDVTGEVNADGSYVVKDVQYGTDYVYFAQVDAGGMTFNSDILHGSDVAGGTADLPVIVYDTTSDLGQLRADRLHIFFDFSQPGKIQVVNLYIISNLGNQVVVSANGTDPVLQFAVPAGAENLQFQDGELGGRYVQTESGFGDLQGVVPGAGQHQVLFAYDLPYDKKLDLSVTVPLTVDAAIVMVPPGGVKLKSDQLADAGTRDMQGLTFQMYQATAPLNTGEALSLKLSGKVGASAAAAAHSDTLTPLLIGLGVFGLALVGGGLWLYRVQAVKTAAEKLDAEDASAQDAGQPAAGESSESLIDAIVALDDLHASGSLPEAAYQDRRADLKARLAEALKREQ